MIIIALIAAVCIYVGLYFTWATIGTHLNQPISWLTLFTQMLFVKQPSIFFILRGLIIIIFFYVIADFFYSSARQGVKSSKKKKAAAANADAAAKAAKQRTGS